MFLHKNKMHKYMYFAICLVFLCWVTTQAQEASEIPPTEVEEIDIEVDEAGGHAELFAQISLAYVFIC